MVYSVKFISRREKEFALVGSIYKGRVTRVLPGMQSAFVDIGLDSDAFLYVGDFLENLEDYDHVVAPVEGKVQKMEQQGGEVFSPPKGGAPAASGPSSHEERPTEAAEAAPQFASSSPEMPHEEEDQPSGNVAPPQPNMPGNASTRASLAGRTAVRADSDKARAARDRARITDGDAAAAAVAGVKAAAAEEEVSAIKDVICLLRNTLRPVPLRPGHQRSRARNCRPTTNPSFCRANPWPNTKTARLKRAALPVASASPAQSAEMPPQTEHRDYAEPSAEAAEHPEQDLTARESAERETERQPKDARRRSMEDRKPGPPAAAAMPVQSPCPIPRPSRNIRRFPKSRRAPFTKAPLCRTPLRIPPDRTNSPMKRSVPWRSSSPRRATKK